MNAGKDRMGPDAALELAQRHRKVVAAKGKNVVELVPGAVEDQAILDAIIGPSGWLRAPAWTRGTTLVVGFNPDAYERVLGV